MVTASSPLEAGDLGPHLHPQLGVEVRQRLVHQEGLGVADDGPAHRHPLPLAARQLRRPAVEHLVELEHGGHLGDPAGDLVLGRRLASFSG